ncbi:hypothetical protein QO239_08305 [Cupriavidus taiwanensis]|uniref:hypothetical protein n=1 Tax=Cupriavidus taiwanensis TaxID=164546 RepID=UPI00254196ED|nr:hypothetical protein [Cupriavidus taiwanensis]MDK3022610.1 hypothetical protein [Cupriavidus taiwanensis]
MFEIHSGDIVAAALAAAGACLACSIPGDFLRRFPLWAVRTYGRGALLMPFMAMMVGTWLFRLGLAGQVDTPPGQALLVAAAFLGTLLVSALLRFYLKEYRKR